MGSDHRRAVGTLGERIAERHLRGGGYEIVGRNLRTRYGELDLVAADRRCLVFCEVKTRVAGTLAGPPGPLDAIGPKKRRRLRRLALDWLAANQAGVARPGRAELRFDAIGVTVDRSGDLLGLEHVEGAL